MATKPQNPDPRNNAREIGDASAIAASLFGTRSPQLTGATTSSLTAYLNALKSGRAGEMNANAKWLRTHGQALKTAQRSVRAAAGQATAPTALSGALERSGARALSDPTAGNVALNDAIASRGPSQLLTTMTGQAQAGLEDNGALTPEEERLAVQGGRAAMASRGLALGSGAALSEVLNRTQYVQQRQDRARAFAGGVEQLGQSSRGQDIALSGVVQGAIEGGRNFALGSNAQAMAKQAQDYGINRDAAGFRLATNPALMAYNTTSMAPTALSAAMGTTGQADVYPQVLNYSANVNDFNANAEWTQYMNALNRYYASRYGGMGTTGGSGGGFNAGGAATGALSGAASGAMMGSAAGPWGTLIGAGVGAVAGGLSGSGALGG